MSHDPGGTGAHLPFVLGIIGDSGSGKSTVAAGVRALLGPERVTSLELDDYHRFTRAERLERGLTALNPAVHDLSLMQEHLKLFRRGRPIRNRSYDHADGSFGPIRTLEPAEVVVARGLLGFPTDELRGAYDLAVFLHPEPELLFRWKLRRDVKTRGYSEAEVLKHIAQHLLDAKQYVLPQADRADLVVRYEVPEWDAPDSEVVVSLVLRRAAAEAARADGSLERLDGVETVERGDDLVVRLDPRLAADGVDGWMVERFPATYTAGMLGTYHDEDGQGVPSAPLALAQGVIADLAMKMRRPADGSEVTGSNGARVAV